LVEFLTAFLFLMGLKFVGISPLLPFYWYLFTLLIIGTFTDFSHLIIPDVVSVPGIFVGLLGSFVFPEMMKASSHCAGLLASFMGILSGGGVIWAIGFFGKAMFKKEAMGGGDVKLMAMVGSFLGIKLTLLAIFLGSVFGAIVGGILILSRLKTRKDYIPFGPYLGLGSVCSLFFGEILLNWYTGLLM
jgi:leader peptidase (prepilin peptidase)/N-methyltransferase